MASATLPPQIDAATAPRRRSFSSSRVADATMAVIVAIGAVVYWQQGRRLSFFYDEWAFITDRRTGGISSLLEPHNGHPSILPAGWYRLQMEVWGLETYVPYRASVLVLHLAAVVLLYVLARRRCAPFFAVVLASLFLFMGSAWQNTMWAFQIGYVGGVVAGLLALLLIERDDRIGDLGAAVVLAAAVLSTGVAIPFLAAVCIELLLQPRRWQRLALVAGPATVAYGIWSVLYGDSEGDIGRIDSAGSYMAEGASGSFAGLVGADMDWGRTFAGVGAALLLVAVATGRVRSPRLAAAATGLCTFFFLTAISRGANATASRYLYIGGVFILLGAAELLRGVKPRPFVMALVLLGAACGIKANLSILDAGTGGLEDEAASMRAELAALEIARDRVPADHFPDSRLLPTVRAGPYLAAIDDLGSPAFDEDELQRAPDIDRAGADRVLLQSLVVDVDVEDAPSDLPASCRAIGPGESVELAAPRASVVTDRVTEVRLRRFSDTAVIVPIAVTTVDPTAVTVDLPADRSGLPWRIEASEPALLCVPPVTG